MDSTQATPPLSRPGTLLPHRVLVWVMTYTKYFEVGSFGGTRGESAPFTNLHLCQTRKCPPIPTPPCNAKPSHMVPGYLPQDAAVGQPAHPLCQIVHRELRFDTTRRTPSSSCKSAAVTYNGDEGIVMGAWYWAVFEGAGVREEESQSP